MAILYVGIDLANVFAIHGVDEHGKAMLVRPSVQRARLHQLVAALPPCTIGMEACSGAHHWARLFAQHGHAVRLMAPKFVAPYRPTQPLGHGTRGQTRLLEGGHRHRRQERPHGLGGAGQRRELQAARGLSTKQPPITRHRATA